LVCLFKDSNFRWKVRARETPLQSEGTVVLLRHCRLLDNLDNGNAAEMGAAGVASMLPPLYVDFKERIRTEMFAIKEKMNELRKLHSKATLITFDDTNAHEAEIEIITQEITRLFRKAEVALQRFGEQRSTSEADEKVRTYCQTPLGAIRRSRVNRPVQVDAGAVCVCPVVLLFFCPWSHRLRHAKDRRLCKLMRFLCLCD
jgi:hypothetical protein